MVRPPYSTMAHIHGFDYSSGVDGAKAWRAVQDSCGGILGGDLPRVFEMAFRGAQARSPMPDAAGAGLGLAIARGLVERHAAVAVENHGAGCRFEVRLPVAA